MGTPFWVRDALILAGDHLWQSTIFGAVVALLALALRHNGARVRYWIWFAASMKFLVPFAALVAIGGQVTWRTVAIVPFAEAPVLIEAVSQPFSQEALTLGASAGRAAARPLADALPGAAVAIWALGCAAFLATWFVRWRRVQAVARRATPLTTGKEVSALRRLAPLHRANSLPIVVSDTPIEPGIFGIHRPVLLWPRGISERLTDEQVEAILAHELCHLRRRDNLAAALHMAVQTIFWFHPLVWWIGARLVDERERACDEDVIRLGSEPEVYAESILKTCQFFVESPLVCVAGVTGSDLKKRIEQIMTNDARQTLSVWRTALLVAAAVMAFVTPVAVGALNPPPATRAMMPSGDLPAFDAVSIRHNMAAGRGGRGGGQMQPGRYTATNLTLRTILRRAFGNPGSGPGNIPDLFEAQIAGGPAWLDTDKFDVVATTEEPTDPAQMRLMLQRLLADRFRLAAHWETRELPVYVLSKGRTDGTLGPALTPASDEECAQARGVMPTMPT